MEVSLTKTDIFRPKTTDKIACFTDATAYGLSNTKIELYMKGDLVTIDHRGDEIIPIDFEKNTKIEEFYISIFSDLKNLLIKDIVLMIFCSVVIIIFVFLRRKSIFIPFFSVCKFFCTHIRCSRFAVIVAIEKSPTKTNCGQPGPSAPPAQFPPSFAPSFAPPHLHHHHIHHLNFNKDIKDCTKAFTLQNLFLTFRITSLLKKQLQQFITVTYAAKLPEQKLAF